MHRLSYNAFAELGHACPGTYCSTAVEMSVLVVQRWILARLRNRQFFSLRELNAAIAELLVDLNRRPFKKLPGCRAEAFESIDRPAMKPLPPTRYEYAEWIKAKVGIDYHAEVDRHYYSVRHSLVGEHVMVRVSDSTVERFFKGGRVAAHVRSYLKGTIGPRERNDLLELLDDRVGARACIVTSQLPVSDWHDYIGDPTLADAILDRLVHRSHRIHLEAKESMRKREAAKESAKAKARVEE